jgi:hypothetical protein
MDIRAPVPEPTPTIKPGKVAMYSTLEVVPDPRASEARLQITQSALNELRAENKGIGPQAFTMFAGQSQTRTIIGGLFMFVALSTAGVLLARKVRATSLSQTPKAILAAVFLGGLIGAAAIITRANAGPPGAYRWYNLPQSLTQGKSISAGIEVEIIPESEMSGARFRLIVPIPDPKPGEQ